jgi:hypothetical protein
MLRRWAGLAMATVVLGVGMPVHAVSAAVISDPAQNVAPSPAYWSVCTQEGTSSQACIDTVVQAIDGARALEGVGSMTLPTGFAALTAAQQTFVVTNLERVDRGLPPVVGMVDSLNGLATAAAGADADPTLSSWSVGSFQVSGWSSIWAGDLNPLAADYDWMYNDGWGPSGSDNLDCQSSGDPGCWGHRNAILRSGSDLITGVGTQQQSRWFSVSQILVSGSGPNPPFTFSWTDVTGGTTPTSDPAPAVTADPTVTAVWTWTTGRSIVAGVDPAVGQRVRLRRHAAAGWSTVRHVAATSRMVFDSVRSGRYRVVVDETASTVRAVAELRVS